MLNLILLIAIISTVNGKFERLELDGSGWPST